jgi:transcriptional regulator with XRE-family HTH domain
MWRKNKAVEGRLHDMRSEWQVKNPPAKLQGVTKRNTEFMKWLTEKLKPFGSQAELARNIGATEPMVGKWKIGSHVVPFCKMVKIARHFNADPKMLCELDEQEEYLEVLHLLHPTYKVLSEEDLYRESKHAELHRKLQAILERGDELTLDAVISNIEVFFRYLSE